MVIVQVFQVLSLRVLALGIAQIALGDQGSTILGTIAVILARIFKLFREIAAHLNLLGLVAPSTRLY